MPIDWNSKLKEALDRTEFMAISTVGSDGSWTNPVAFAYSEKMELLFISMMDSKHSQNILKNPDVSAAIFKTERFSDGEVLGLQLKGTASHLTDPKEIEYAAKYYFGRSEANDEFKNLTSLKDGANAVWQFFKIVPTEVWCFDSRVFGEKRVEVDMKSVNIDHAN
jgi:uncharacterized protein YhbP (UPF0306 family)